MDQQDAGSGTDGGGKNSAIVITKDDLAGTPPKPPAAPKPALAAPPSRPAPAPETASVQPAGFWLRVLAKVLDLVLALAALVIVPAVVGAALWFAGPPSPVSPLQVVRSVLQPIVWQALLGFGIFYFAYSVLLHAANGRTLGKAICGLRVLTPRNAENSVFSALLYFIARFLVSAMSLVLFGIGCLIAGFRKDKRALNDLVVGSRVVREPPARE